MDDQRAFQLSVNLVIGDEVLTSDPDKATNDMKDDPDGGLTKYGIAQKQHPNIDVASLTRDGAIAIYRTDYWVPSWADRTPWPLSLMLFDTAVNQGVGTAEMLLRCALGQGGAADRPPLKPLLDAAAGRDPWELTARFTALRLKRYVDTKGYPEDGEGWFYRVSKNLLAAGRQPG
jgi:lysozyme family protein